MSVAAIDATGAWIEPAAPPWRIVSLVPSLTEALFALGVGPRVVGVTRYCEEPAPAVAALPRVGGTKNPDVAAILALAPDLVIASIEENRAEDVAALRAAGLRVFVTHYPDVRAALDGIVELAGLVGGDVEIAASWRAETERAIAARRERPVRYFCPIWRRPYMVARRDTYMADLLALAGGESAVSGEGPLRYNAIDLAEAMAAQPDVILLPSEPYPFAARHLRDFAPFTETPAVRHARIALFDGKLLTWYGPRIPRALAFFADLFARVRHGEPLLSVTDG